MKFPLRWRKLREKFDGNIKVILSLREFPKSETAERVFLRRTSIEGRFNVCFVWGLCYINTDIVTRETDRQTDRQTDRAKEKKTYLAFKT